MIVLTPPAGWLAKAVKPSPGQLPLFGTGPFVGPRGGLWADPQHTVHWSGPVDVKPHDALGMYPIKVNVAEKMTKAVVGPFVGPRGGLWADPEHKVHWVADPNGRGARQADWVGKEPAAVRSARAKRITAALAGFKVAADRYKRTRERRDYDAVFRAITEYGHAAALQPQGRDGLAEVAAAKLRAIGHRIPQPPRLEHRPETATQLALFSRKVMFDLRKSRLAQLSQRA